MNWNKHSLFVGIALFVVACSEPSETAPVEGAITDEETLPTFAENEINVVLKGKISGAANKKLSLEVLSDKGKLKLAESIVSNDGTFQLKTSIQGMGLYQLQLDNERKVIPLTLEPNDTIRIEGAYENFERLPKLSGAQWAKTITRYMEIFNEFANKQTALIAKPGLSEAEQIKEFMILRKPLDAFAKAEMLKYPDNPANIVLSTSMTPAMGFDNWDATNLDVLKKVAIAYELKYEGSPIAASMTSQVNQIQAGLSEYTMSKKQGSALENKLAPDISLKNPEGKTITLSSLRGKVVLIDFWASWCGPCRQENPNVVRAYNKFKDKGFTVYSVSLDKDAEAWKRAIKSDGLIWPNHVSDLKQWESPMPQLYGFNGIPYTVLIDKKGKIIGTNLRGAALEQKLNEILK